MEIFEKAAMVIAAVVIVLVFSFGPICVDWLRGRKAAPLRSDDDDNS